MPSYEITAVHPDPRPWKAQGKYDMLEYRVDLRGPNSEGATVDVPHVEWSRKKESPAPRVGQTLDVEKFESKQQGLKLHLAQQLGGGTRTGPVNGSSRDFKADPVKQAGVAMEASQKVATDIVLGALQHGQDYETVLRNMEAVADRVYARVQHAMKDAGQ